MDERERIRVSIHDLLRTIFHFLPLIICWSVFCGTLLYYYSEVWRKPVFEADTSIYVLSRTADEEYGRLDMNDLDVSRQMKIDALSILSSEQMAEKVLVNLKGDAEPLQMITASDLLQMIELRSPDDSLELAIIVKGSDPFMVCDVANTYRETAIQELNDRIMARGIQTTKEAIIPLGPSGRTSLFYGAAGLLIGLVSSLILVTLIYIVRYAKRDSEDVRTI